MATQEQVAADFLRHSGAPNTEQNRKAVIAWFRQESGRTIIGNNPGNITKGLADNLPVKPCGYRKSKAGFTFAVYCTLDDGLKATAAALRINDGRGYAVAGNALRAGDPVGFLNGIARSGWSGSSHYGMGAARTGTNKLLGIFKGLGGDLGSFANAAPPGVTGGATPRAISKTATEWYNRLAGIGLPNNPEHVITESEAAIIAEKLYGVDPQLVKSALVGKTVGSLGAAYEAGETTMGSPVPDFIGQFGGMILGGMAIIAGAGLFLFGLYSVMSRGKTPIKIELPKVPKP